jgi:tetratricopeptide (TPR) repeat protein
MSHAFRSLRALPVALGAVVAIATHLAAQATAVERLADSLRVAIGSAVDAGEFKGLDDAIALADRALAAFPDSPLLLHYRAYVLYEAGTLAIGRAGAAQARPYIEKARAVLEPLVKRETIAESYALLASVYGLQIGLSRVPMFAGMQLGPKSSEWMDRAVAAGPRNPRVWLLKGIGDIHTPKAFGGGSDKAEQHLKQALALFAVDKPAPPLPTWGLAEAHLWLGQVYAARGQPDSARAEYNLALALQPRNGWITKVLIPALAKIRR